MSAPLPPERLERIAITQLVRVHPVTSDPGNQAQAVGDQGVIDGPQAGGVEPSAFAGVDPCQQQVGNVATLAGVALGDSDLAFKGGAGIQVHRGHQAPLYKRLAGCLALGDGLSLTSRF